MFKGNQDVPGPPDKITAFMVALHDYCQFAKCIEEKIVSGKTEGLRENRKTAYLCADRLTKDDHLTKNDMKARFRMQEKTFEKISAC